MAFDDDFRELSGAFHNAVQKVEEAAASSLKAAKHSRARTRRERIQSDRMSAVPSGLEMPSEWRDDEATTKIPHAKKEHG